MLNIANIMKIIRCLCLMLTLGSILMFSWTAVSDEENNEIENCCISGVIMATDGTPIYDVDIHITSLDKEPSQAIKDLVFSNEEGFYEFYEIPLGKYEILVSSDGFIDESKIININIDEKEKIIDFTLSKCPIALISGKILCSDKKTPYGKGLFVYATDKEGKVYSSFTDKNGKFLIEDVPYGKSYKVAVVSKGNILATKSLILKEGIDVQNVNFIIEARGEIYGVISLLDNNKQIPLADIVLAIKSNSYTTWTYSDKEGKYHFYRVPYGTYILTIIPKELKDKNSWTKFKQIEDIQIDDSKKRHELNILLEERW